MIPRWLGLSAAWVFGIALFAVVAREFPVLGVLVALICGLAAGVYLIARRRSVSPLEIEREVGKLDRFIEDIPPGPPPTG